MSTDNKPLDLNKVIVIDNNDPYENCVGVVKAKVRHGKVINFIVQFTKPSDWSYFKSHQIRKHLAKHRKDSR